MTEVQSAARKPIDIEWLGTLAYGAGLDLQERLVEERRRDRVNDRLLLLEHPHVITLGTSANADHVLLDAAERGLLGIELFETGRGGDVTYHGPGQLVGYPILDLKPDRRDLHRYVRDLEETLIRVVSDFGISAEREPGRTGVWVSDRKIAAIGVRVSSGWITSHGFALNVSTDLRFFESIVPCGIRDAGVVSMAELTDAHIDMNDVIQSTASHLCEVFERQPVGALRRQPERLVASIGES